MPESPVGGTELMMSQLMSRIDPALLEGVSIFNYIGQADFNKTTIYWNQLNWDQDAVRFLEDQDIRNRIDYFVFVSHWQSEKFREKFRIPGYKTHVIKNACGPMKERDLSIRNELVRVCHLSTPWRGLDTLLDAWDIIKPDGAELHVFSSTKIYGADFHSVSDKDYYHLYKRAEAMDGVVYRGFLDNESLRSELPSFDIMAYPCKFEETSCIAAIESLSAGLKVVCSNIGALPETTEGWATMYTYRENPELHARHFAAFLSDAIRRCANGTDIGDREIQRKAYGERWSWDRRINEWTDFLTGVQAARTPSVAKSWDDQIHREVYVENEYRIGPLSQEDTVVDIGAHKGSFARRCLDNGAGRVVCYEPSPENFAHLDSIFGDDPRVTLVNKAVWSKSGLSISFSPRLDVDPQNTARATAFTSNGTVRVETVSLDDILSGLGHVKVLKVDAEGAEYPILMSSEMLHRVEMVVGEMHEVSAENGLSAPLSYRRPCGPKDLVEHLSTFGFDTSTYNTLWPLNTMFESRRPSNHEP